MRFNPFGKGAFGKGSSGTGKRGRNASRAEPAPDPDHPSYGDPYEGAAPDAGFRAYPLHAGQGLAIPAPAAPSRGLDPGSGPSSGQGSGRGSDETRGPALEPPFGDPSAAYADVPHGPNALVARDAHVATAPFAYDDGDDDATDAPAEGWLTVQGVKKTYGRKNVVKGVSLSVRRGESVGLLGPNGAGKTTVFYMITGLVPSDEGSIHIDGQDVTALPMYRRARLGIGYLPQESSIFRGLSVEDNIMAVLEIVEPKRKLRKQKLDALLEEFTITRLRKDPSTALSGGERRRCEIARALASNPSFILLDEPFAGIDPIAVGDIQELVRHLTKRGIGVLITDHNWRETLSLIDRAYIIADGHVLTQGTPDEIRNNPDVRRVYLGDNA
ncbi:MAG: LPS export ABC transporter ATP-binding protein [Pseudomonadota bacterium]